MVCETARQWYHGLLARLNNHSGSALLCQVVVLNAMKPRRLSPKVILQISLWSVIVIVLSFIALYSFLLTYMNKHIIEARFHHHGNTLKNKYSPNSPKVRLKSKQAEKILHNVNVQNITLYVKQGNDSLRKVLWKMDFDDVFSVKPHCYNETAILTVLVTSSPNHFQQRTQIRNTWCGGVSASGSKQWQCVFLVGETSSWQVEKGVDEEAQEFHDILRGTYYDSYRNLTIKVMHGLYWNSQTCTTPYTLKTDDDCFVNILQLHNFLANHNKISKRLYAGNVYYLLEKRKVIRNKDNKWSVPEEHYALDYYPPYASGTGYVLSDDMVQAIVLQSPYIQVIPNEDAYIGMVVDSLGVEPVSSDRFTLFSVGLQLCNYVYVLVSHGVKPEEQQIHYDNMFRAQKMCQTNEKATSVWS